ncbi:MULTISPECIES: ornithine cyclodeaminase family protein [unclassified Gordonia (in: high G+C Gram-positive bacteria)]|uniref:ornithine cyclodeaminase family protein n=1 Tax=unclassified Gordonia (in: high G+C Gram-positive bacteria) TaxID=2657482 RepID=UPI0020005379|nr:MULTISPECIES: ornithine cyclodeaminase family protein [unclassified Gordonia (in: high G+C Gram-positive bacteria)]UQE73938.1 ornithine cyclodeaminase family protein [Gordonia sp. PP30]
MGTLDFLNAERLTELASEADAVDFLYDALASGRVDPELDDPRLFSPAPGGEFLLMPGRDPEYSGVKLLTVAPDNPARGKPKIQGVYALFSSDDLAPLILLDGPELTLLRTPAVTVLAVRGLLDAGPGEGFGEYDRPLRVVVYGTGPQALRHLHVMRTVLGPIDAAVIGRRPDRVDELVAQATGDGLRVRAGTPDDVRTAEVVLTATSSTEPVLDDALVGPDTVIAAMGVHGPDNAELPPELVLRADVVVEARGAAMRESGNLLRARSVQDWAGQPLANLADLVTGNFRRRPGAPAVFSGVGMSWEDLVVASAIYQRHHAGRAGRDVPPADPS